MSDFQKLRRSSSIEKLTKALDKQNTYSKNKDDRYWQPTVDKAGNGFAVIRFLDAPAVDGADADPFVRIFKHAFEGPSGKWYIELNRSTIGQSDPVSELNKRLWDTGSKENQKTVSKQKRKLSYVSNIQVINDPAHPENNGKTFLYSYGKKIMDKIKDKAGITEDGTKPDFVDPDEVKFDAFNFWEGANFKLKIRKVEGYRNYDKSEFDKQSAVADDDAKIEVLWKSLHSLKALIDPKNFKSYDDLKVKLITVLGGDSGGAAGGTARSAETVNAGAEPDEVEEVPTSAQADAEIAAAVSVGDDDEEDFSKFEKLATL